MIMESDLLSFLLSPQVSDFGKQPMCYTRVASYISEYVTTSWYVLKHELTTVFECNHNFGNYE